jgi:hypothetical protein
MPEVPHGGLEGFNARIVTDSRVLPHSYVRLGSLYGLWGFCGDPQNEGKTSKENPPFCLQPHSRDVDTSLRRGKSLKRLPSRNGPRIPFSSSSLAARKREPQAETDSGASHATSATTGSRAETSEQLCEAPLCTAAQVETVPGTGRCLFTGPLSQLVLFRRSRFCRGAAIQNCSPRTSAFVSRESQPSGDQPRSSL